MFKLLRKADAFALRGGMAPSPHRQAQIDAILADQAAALQVHDRLKCMTPKAQDRLVQQGLLLLAPFDPSTAWRGAVDLSPATFDDWLLRAYAPAVPVLGSYQRA